MFVAVVLVVNFLLLCASHRGTAAVAAVAVAAAIAAAAIAAATDEYDAAADAVFRTGVKKRV